MRRGSIEEYRVETLSTAQEGELPRRAIVTLSIRPSKPEPYQVSLRWSGAAEDGKTHVRAYRSRQRALERIQEIVTRQRQNGFHVALISPTHPLREWLESERAVGRPKNGDPQMTLF